MKAASNSGERPYRVPLNQMWKKSIRSLYGIAS
jgi:hypothetical protein